MTTPAIYRPYPDIRLPGMKAVPYARPMDSLPVDPPGRPVAPEDAKLRRDIRRLGELLGETLVRQESQGLLDQVENVRQLTKAAQRGDESATRELAKSLSTVDLQHAMLLVRSFATYFHLANIAEQVDRAAHLAERPEDADWINQAMDRIIEARGPAALTTALSRLSVRPVYTAHPTEASRRTALLKMREIADALIAYRAAPTARNERRRDRRLAELIESIWQSDDLRVDQPKVADEARNMLFFVEGLLEETVPGLLSDLAEEAARRGAYLHPPRAPSSWATGSAATAMAIPMSRPRSPSMCSSCNMPSASADSSRWCSNASTRCPCRPNSWTSRPNSPPRSRTILTNSTSRSASGASMSRSPIASSSRASANAWRTPAIGSRVVPNRAPGRTMSAATSCSPICCSSAIHSWPTTANSSHRAPWPP